MRRFRLFLWFTCACVAAFISTANAGTTHFVGMATGPNRFVPSALNIVAGDTVIWTNIGFVQHTVTPTNNNEGFCGTRLLTQCTWTFTQAGSFRYFCIPHYNPPFQNMTGVVVVASPPNAPPTITIASPANGANFGAPASFQLSANPSDSDGSVTKVDFFVNGSFFGSASPPSFSISVPSLDAGAYTLTAVATDDDGATGAATPVSITVTQQTVALPRYALNIAVAPAGSGTATLNPPQPETGYESNTAVTITAMATNGFAFTNWSGDASGTANPITITMGGPRSVVANFTPSVVPSWTLSISTNPPEAALVQVEPAPNGPNGTYLDGTIVVVSVTLTPGFEFVGWSGDINTNSPVISFAMDSDKSLAANFNPPSVLHLAVSVNPPNLGRVLLPAPVSSNLYASGSVVTVTATPIGLSRFIGWSGSETSSLPELSVLMNEHKSLVANFEPIIPEYRLVLGTNPVHGGSILISEPPRTNGTYAPGTALAAAAIPNPGFVFSGWTGDVLGATNPVFSFVLPPDPLIEHPTFQLTALFAPAPSLDFGPLADSYEGLLMTDGNPNHTASGPVTLRVSRTGGYHGTMTIGGLRQMIVGRFDRFGRAPLVMRRGTLNGSLEFTETNRITGTLSDGLSFPALLLYRNGSVTNAAALEGTYTLMLGTNGPVTTQSTATMTIARGGVVRIRGALADGARVVDRSSLTFDGRVPVSAMLYGGAGSLLGWLNITTNSTVEGTLHWMRPTDSRSQDFPGGFAIQVPVTGTRQ